MNNVKESENVKINNWEDSTELKKLMDEWGDVDFPFYGVNQNNEEIEIHVANNSVILVTYQENGWVRKNTYYRDSHYEETFEGKWNEQ